MTTNTKESGLESLIVDFLVTNDGYGTCIYEYL